jgi:chromosome segregation ATPase
MGKTSSCQADVDCIIRRLRGKETPYTPAPPRPTPVIPQSHEEEKSEPITAIETKLKSSYQEFSQQPHPDNASAVAHERLVRSIDQLQTSLCAKDQELAEAKESARVAKASMGQMEKELSEARSQHKTAPEQMASMQEELMALRDERLLWEEERKKLETAAEQERLRRRSETSTSTGQFVRLAMNCKQLEEEIHSLKCEKAATARQCTQMKELNEETNTFLAEEREKRRSAEEALASSQQATQGLLNTIEEHKATIRALTAEKTEASRKEAEFSGKITELNLAVAKNIAALEDLSVSFKSAEESRSALRLQLEHEKRSLHEAQEKTAQSQREKEVADARVKEVEELLITKVQTMSDLEEQLGEAIANGEDLEHKVTAAEQHIKDLTSDLQTMTKERDELHEKAMALEQRLVRATNENAELKKRSEVCELLKKCIADASSHAHAILRTLDHGQKPSRIAPHHANEELSLVSAEPERSLFEEQFEQHELF